MLYVRQLMEFVSDKDNNLCKPTFEYFCEAIEHQILYT